MWKSIQPLYKIAPVESTSHVFSVVLERAKSVESAESAERTLNAFRPSRCHCRCFSSYRHNCHILPFRQQETDNEMMSSTTTAMAR